MQELDWGRAIRMAAGSAGLTYAELAARAGIARSHLYSVKAGPACRGGRPGNPSIPTLLRLAQAAGVSLSTLVAWAEGEV